MISTTRVALAATAAFMIAAPAFAGDDHERSRHDRRSYEQKHDKERRDDFRRGHRDYDDRRDKDNRRDLSRRGDWDFRDRRDEPRGKVWDEGKFYGVEHRPRIPPGHLPPAAAAQGF